MSKKLRILLGGITALLLAIAFFTFVTSTRDTHETQTIEQQRETHAKLIENSPFKETLTWDKKKRKLAGLPPNRYFEQMWELSINPTTGKLDNDELNIIRENLRVQRQALRNPGEAGNAWEERGPNDIGGRTRVIMFDPNDSSNNTVYAGGVSGGLWKNSNITNTNSLWTRVQNVPGNLAVTSITVDPNNSNRWFVGTGEQYTAGDVVGNGVYVTTNGGDSWSALNIPAAGSATFDFSATNLFLSGFFYVNDVLAWNNNGNTELFVGVGAQIYGDASSPNNYLGLQTAGLYHSANGGTTWNRIESANMEANTSGANTYYVIPNDLEVGADNKLWMGSISNAFGSGGGKVYSSTNGTTWTEAGASPLTDSNRVELEPSASNPNKLYALTQGAGAAPVHIYSTTNSFGSISSTSLPNDADTGIPANDFCRGQAFYDLVIEADPNNDNIVYVGGIDLFKSTNSGSSWSQLSHWYGGFGQPNNVHADQHSIAFGNNSSSRMLFGNDGGVYYSGNAGSTITKRVNGYNVTQYVKAGIGPDGQGSSNVIFTAGAQDNGSQGFRGNNTSPGVNGSEELSDGDGFYTFVDKDGQYMIATYVYNQIYRFNLPWNGLGRRQGGATTLSSDQSSGDFVNQMGFDSDANRLLTNASSGSTYRIKSINVASNSSGTLTNSALTGKPTAFGVSPFANNTWHVGLSNGGLVRLTNVTNSSATFTTISTPFIGAVSSVRYGETSNDIFVTIHNYGVTSVWSTSNGGSSWQNKEGDLPNIPVRDMLQNPLNRNEAILATQLGIWSTNNFNDANPSWSQAYNGMSDVSVTSLDYWAVNGNDADNKIIASTYGRGVFTGKFEATTVVDNDAPSAPTSLSASNTTQDTTDLSWTASTDNIGVSGYDVIRDGIVIASVSGTTTNYQATGLSADTTYAFSIKAKDAAGNESVSSNIINVTTEAPDTTAPSAPTSLIASGVTENLANLSWTASTDNVGVTSYDILRDGTVIGNSTNTNFTATGLAAETQYTFTVVAKDAVGNTSAVSNTATITTDAVPVTYCASQSSNVNDEYISRVQLNTIDNTSGAQFYSDFTSVSTNLTKDSQYTITITPTWTGTVYNESYGVWIDYNMDGDFTDSGEQVFAQGNTQATSVSGTFTIPPNAVENSTRMRVSMKYNAAPNSCEAFQYGEVEDYTIVIEGSGPDTEAPIITLNGASTVNLNQGEVYNELGATATDNIDGDLTSSIVTSGTVNTNTPGIYTVTYSVSDAAGNNASTIRTVNVIADTIAPVITLNGSSSVTLELQQAYNELGATATDNIDGDLTSSIVTSGSVNTNVAGTYTITYSVSDAAGNSDSTTRTVTVNPDTTAPVISLVGASIINLNVGDSYTDQGATATDNIDGNLTSSIVVSGSVNTNVSGNYTLTYNVSDAAGNAATPVSRVVNVNEVANGCSGGISTFPYSEGFENGIGSWTQSSADDLNWTVDANGTPSSNTGPSSAIQGSNYIFVEASGNGTGYPNKRAIITSPCFDLSSATEANFTFKYHMFGSTNAGSVALEVSNNEGVTWTSLWNQTGNQGNQWLTVNIDLAAYIGSGIQLRFNRITGGTWQADVAIDDIGLNDGGTTPVDCDTLNFNDYTLNSFSTQDSNGANSIGNGGTSLTLTNNTWKYIDFPYTVTVNTVIELEFSSTSEGEIHGIGFENDNSLTSSFYFKFYGTQNYGITNFDNYTSGTTTYVITVGDSYTGVMDRLVFINDNDAGSGNNSTFANVKIYETSCPSSRGEVVFGERVDILGNEDENTFNMKMYPNPVRDILHVETTGIENASYRIVNMLGQTVLRGSYINQIEVGTLNSGMYFLEVNTGKKSVSQKFIKK